MSYLSWLLSEIPALDFSSLRYLPIARKKEPRVDRICLLLTNIFQTSQISSDIHLGIYNGLNMHKIRLGVEVIFSWLMQAYER